MDFEAEAVKALQRGEYGRTDAVVYALLALNSTLKNLSLETGIEIDY